MELYIEKQSASEAIEKAIRVALGLPHVHGISRISITTSAGVAEVPVQNVKPNDVKAVLGLERLRVQLGWLQTSSLGELKTTVIYLASSHNELVFTLAREALYDKVTLHGQVRDITQMMAMIDNVGTHYQAVPSAKRLQTDVAIRQAAPHELLSEVTRRLTDSAIDLRAATKEGLEHFLASVAAIDKQVTEKVHAEHAKLREEIASERTRLHAEIHEERAKAHAEIDTERTKLQDERAAFEAEKKKLDDRRSTHVRREIFQELKKALGEQKKVELSRETSGKIWPIRIVCGVVALFGASLAGFGVYLMLKHGELGFLALAPFSSGILIFALNALYFMRFSNAWLARHADLETRNQVLQFDMARASWFAEMLFEYQDEKQGTVPDAVIQVMTKNLFDLQSGDSVKHPVDDFATFLTRVNKIRLGEGEIEMDASVNGKARDRKK
ncbi:hypothetical protein [Polyangium spumosum]|uniref:Uncharacterized protein n=1 Tax=Polyangium spumosum TaxID=889282 RepID=A0A6N7PZA3_9BACT|nr:hypothetical protein [Polyangium spumosum]MRG95364.1 hypothetical protein [Polyangium spumosum]